MKLSRTIKKYARKTLNKGPKYGFLHIGKTGGTTISSLARELAAQGHFVPTIFGHASTMRAIINEDPLIRLSVTIRDPIERIVSAFNSRLRQSRPTYTALWTTEEAVAYLWFPNVTSFLEARMSDDERLKYAGLWAEKAMGHVRRGYGFHFHSADFVRKNADRFYFVGTLDNLSSQAHRYFEPCGIRKELIDGKRVEHSGKGSTQSDLSHFDSDFLQRIRSLYAEEYRIFEALRELADRDR